MHLTRKEDMNLSINSVFHNIYLIHQIPSRVSMYVRVDKLLHNIKNIHIVLRPHETYIL